MSLAIDRRLVRDRIEQCRRGEGMIKQYAGFVQLNPPGIHINFFHPEPGRFITAPAHTHDIGFTSTILLGEMNNARVTVEEHPDGDLQRYATRVADHSQQIWFEETPERVVITDVKRETWHVGDTYNMDPREYHVVKMTVPTITYLRLWPETEADAYTLFKPGQGAPRAERYVTEEQVAKAWERVDEMCRLAEI